MDNMLLIPGLGGNGPEHWQSHWEENREDNRPNCRSVPGVNWNTPEKTMWLSALDDAITSCESPPILIAHSLGCMLAVHWALRMKSTSKVKAALLVAPPDVDSRDHTPAETACFAPVPLGILPFPAKILASSNDPYCDLERSQLFATAWGTDFANLGDLGHLNGDSHLGNWDTGWGELNNLVAQSGKSALKVG